jgi:ParB family chromosome partitioning protein
MAKIKETREIKIADLVIGKAQARSRDAGKDIDELVSSIKKQGLLQPICVCPSEVTEGKYDVLIGQRRLAAHQLLERDTIMASIFDEHVDEIEAKVISLTENMVRTDMNSKDTIDVCTWLFGRYGSIAAVAEETGLSKARVSDNVKGARLKEGVKELVRQGTVDLKVALDAQDTIEATGDYDEERAVALAKEMQGMSKVQRTLVTELVVDDPDKPIGKLVEDVKELPISQVTIVLGAEQQKVVEAYMKQHNTNYIEALGILINETLHKP